MEIFSIGDVIHIKSDPKILYEITAVHTKEHFEYGDYCFDILYDLVNVDDLDDHKHRINHDNVTLVDNGELDLGISEEDVEKWLSLFEDDILLNKLKMDSLSGSIVSASSFSIDLHPKEEVKKDSSELEKISINLADILELKETDTMDSLLDDYININGKINKAKNYREIQAHRLELECVKEKISLLQNIESGD